MVDSIFTRDAKGRFPFKIWRYSTRSDGCIGGDAYPVIAKQIERIVRKASVARRLKHERQTFSDLALF